MQDRPVYAIKGWKALDYHPYICAKASPLSRALARLRLAFALIYVNCFRGYQFNRVVCSKDFLPCLRMASIFRGGYSISDQASTYFLTATVVDWIELFVRPQLADIILDSMRFCIQNKGLQVHAWCLMPNHIHLLCTQSEGNLSDVLRDFKRHTATTILTMLCSGQINESRKRWLLQRLELAASNKPQNYKVWQAGNHPILCNGRAFFEQRFAYIHDNPVKAGFVYEPQHYRYSSAMDYSGKEGLIPLVKV